MGDFLGGGYKVVAADVLLSFQSSSLEFTSYNTIYYLLVSVMYGEGALIRSVA
jgi:hypothetical protein